MPRSASAIRSSSKVKPGAVDPPAVDPHAVDPHAVEIGQGQRGIGTSISTLYSLIAMRTVDSATERSLPGVPGHVTVTASFHKRTAMAAAEPSRSGVEPGGVYGEIAAVHA